jgi:hypothetical protein
MGHAGEPPKLLRNPELWPRSGLPRRGDPGGLMKNSRGQALLVNPRIKQWP